MSKPKRQINGCVPSNTRRQPQKSSGSGWSAAIHPDDRDEVFADWQDTWRYEREFNMKFRFKTQGNIISDVHVHAVPTRSTKTNKVIGFFGIVKVLHVYKDKSEEEEEEVDLN